MLMKLYKQYDEGQDHCLLVNELEIQQTISKLIPAQGSDCKSTVITYVKNNPFRDKVICYTRLLVYLTTDPRVKS